MNRSCLTWSLFLGGWVGFKVSLSVATADDRKMTKFGEIDHLRGWETEKNSASKDNPDIPQDSHVGENLVNLAQAEDTDTVIICDLCDQMGSLAPAVSFTY